MRHTGTLTLTTRRLVLRRLLPDDAAQMYAGWASDPAVTRWLRWAPHRSPEETRRLLTAWAPLYANADYYQWAITDRETGEVFGSISLFESPLRELGGGPEVWRTPGLDLTGSAWEAGYCLSRARWGQGFATEALQAMVDHWFAAVGGSWLACGHARENPASGRVMRHAGFCYDHEAVYHKFDGTPVPCRVYCLPRAVWAAGRQAPPPHP